MNERKELLNEESYLKSKNKLLKIAKIILITGLVIGLGLIIGGILVISNANKDNSSQIDEGLLSYTVVPVNNETTTTERTKEVIQSEIDAINDELASLKARKNTEFTTNGFSEEYYKLDNEIDKKTKQVRELEDEISDIEFREDAQNGMDQMNDFFQTVTDDSEFGSEVKDTAKKGFASVGGIIMIYVGICVIGGTLLISGIIFIIAKKRDIAAFSMQQTMPLAQEGIEKMSPTVGKAAGTIGKEIAKGISEGIKEGKDEE